MVQYRPPDDRRAWRRSLVRIFHPKCDVDSAMVFHLWKFFDSSIDRRADEIQMSTNHREELCGGSTIGVYSKSYFSIPIILRNLVECRVVRSGAGAAGRCQYSTTENKIDRKQDLTDRILSAIVNDALPASYQYCNVPTTFLNDERRAPKQ